MCDCFARVFGVSWAPGADSAAEGHGPESHLSRTRRQAPLAESKRNDPPAPAQIPSGLHSSPLFPEEAADPDRAAQKEKLHAELKRVLQQKGASRASPEEAAAEEEEEELPPPGQKEAPLLRKMETPELLEIIVETEAEAGVSGVNVAGGGRQGLFVKDVLKGSPAAQALRLREGDQLLSARVYFDNMKYEDALQILKSAEPYKVSFCLKRTVPSTGVAHSPGAPPFEAKGPKAKVAKLSIQSLTSLKKKPKKAGKGSAKDLRGEAARGSQELVVAPVDVEFSVPKFSKLRKARSTGEVAAAAPPSPDLSPLLSSLETKRRRLKLPRLRVREALAARAMGRLDGAPPKAHPGQKAAASAGAGGKSSRFTVPFSKGKKPKEEEAAGQFQAPQVELDFPVPKVGPGRGSPKAGAGHKIHVPPIGLPQVEVALPKGSPAGPEAPREGPLAGLRLPAAEVAAPQVDLALSLPRLEGAPPDVTPRGDGLQLKVPKVGVSAAKETERKPALLDAIVGIGRAAVEGLEEKLAMPSLEVEIPLPRGKGEAEAPKPKMEIPEVSLEVPKLGSKPREEEEEEEESRVPELELSVGRWDSPKAEAKSPTPSVGLSWKSESREAPTGPAEGKTRSLGLKVPSLDISAPRVPEVPLPKSLVGLAVRAPEGQAEVAAEGPRFKLQMPQVSLPKCSTPKAMPSPPQGPRKPQGEAGGKAGVLALDLSLPTGKPLDVQLPQGHVPKPESGLHVDRPRGDVALPAARLSFPSATAPALELDLPRAAIGLGFPKADSERQRPDRPQRDHEATFKMPTMETLSKGLSVEISVPKYVEGGEQPERQPGLEASEGPGLGAIVAKIPQVDLAFGTEAAAAAAEASVGRKGGPETGGSAKLPSVEISAIKFPQATAESDKSPEAEVKLKSPKFALPKFSISGPKVWKVSTELFGAQGESPEAAERGSRLKMPKFGIAFPKSKGGADAEGPKPAPGGERRSPPEKPAESRRQWPALVLPKVEVEVPTQGKDEPSSGDGSGTVPELGLELPDIRPKMPKFSLPRFGGKGKEGEAEPEKGEKEGRAKASRFKMALFGGMGRGPEGGETKAQKGAESPREKPGGPLPKTPSPKAELLHGHIPQVELPQLRLPEARLEEALLVEPGSPSGKARVPSLEIAMPGAPTQAEPAPQRPQAEGEADVKKPSLAVSLPQVELDLSLPSPGAEPPLLHAVPGAEAKIKLPQVELPALGRGEEGAAGGGGGGERGTAGAAKLWVPQVDLALPKVAPPGGEGDGPEGRFQLPSVGLPKFPTPKVSAPVGSPEGGRVKLSSPAQLRLPKLKGPSKEGEGEAELTLPQLELKVPKLGGSAERLGAEAEAVGPCPPPGFGLCQAGGEAEEGAAPVGPDSKFKLALPSLSLSKAGAEPRADTQPLCPPRKEGDAAFRRPQIALPEVGFSVGQEGRAEAKEEAGKLASAEGLGAEGSEAWGKMTKVKVPAKGGRDDPEGKAAAFRVPGLELAAPALKAHAEYQVEGAQEAGRRARAGSDGRKSPRGRGEAADAEAAKKHKGKVPKFTLAWPKAGEGAAGQEAEAKAKRAPFALGRPRGRGTEATSGLLEGDEEADGKGVMGRLKLGLSRLKTGPEVNGELEDGSSRGGRLPKVGFSRGEGAEAALQNGAQDAKAKLGKIRLPQVELSSPSPTAESDPELSLELVGADEAKEGPGAWAALRFKPPKISFLGFRERNGEPASGALVPSAARTEMASLERDEASRKGEKPPKFKFPKVALSPKAHRAEAEARGAQEGLKLQVPKVGFSEEAGRSPPQVTAEGKGEASAAL